MSILKLARRARQLWPTSRYMRRDMPNGDASRYCHAAIASTFRDDMEGLELTYKDWRDYRPSFES